MPRKSRPAGSPKVACAYVRVSTVEQDLGPEAQRAAIEAWARSQGVTVAAWHEDRLSGSTPVHERPGFLGALESLRTTGAGLLVTAKRDRLARSVAVAVVAEELVREAGARVVTADGVADGDRPEDAFMRTIQDAVSQLERARIAQRTRAALAVKRGRGERVSGQIPFGFHLAADGIHLVTDAAEQAVVALVKVLRAEGLSLRAIGAALVVRGFLPRTGAAWHPETVATMVRASEAA
jgi:DNA invertase Pin-like site-specific DNA recombinase